MQEQKLGKGFCKTSFQLGMDQKKVQEQRRDERTQEDYPTMEWCVEEKQEDYPISAEYFCRCRVVSSSFSTIIP